MKKTQFDFDDWRMRILELRDQNTHNESLEFWNLVDMVQGMRNIDIARILFQTFTNKPDHGVKESVVCALESFDVETYYRAYLEELPRLLKETQKTGWYYLQAYSPLGELDRKDADKLVCLVKSMPMETQEAFIDIISNEDFMFDNEWADYVLKRLKIRKTNALGEDENGR